MKQKQRIAFLGVVAAALILMSCGGDSGNNSSESEGNSSSSVEFSSSSGQLSSSSAVKSSSSSLVSSSSVKVQSSSSVPLSSSVGMYSSSSVGVLSSSSIEYGTLTYEGQTYKTVLIGTQTWMAENLNYTPSNGNSWCYRNMASYCATYGRLYDWNTLMAGSVSSEATPSGVQGICPEGWHVPSIAEWTILENAVGGNSTAGKKLKANSSLWFTNIGTDDYGFSALPGGFYFGSVFFGVESNGTWWSATAYSSTDAYTRYMSFSRADVYSHDGDKTNGYSLRCVKDD